MQKRVYAYTDESGNHGFNFSQSDISTHFIVTSILVGEDNRELLETEMEAIRKKYFQTGEIKSSSVGKNHKRRCSILNQILKLDFKIFAVVIDKREIDADSGLQYKQTFYKFTNNLVHKELRAAFPILTICADELGTNEYMQGFIKYVKEREEYPDLFQQRNFYFENSKNSVIVQLADFISGTLLFSYDAVKREGSPDYLSILRSKIIRIENYPKKMMEYVFNGGALAVHYDQRIANISLKRAQMFISKFDDSNEEDVKIQLQVLKYLCFRFINNDTRDYISTKEIMSYLKRSLGVSISVQYFRTRIIAKLRDNNVIISSSPKGYKLPSKEAELYDFINHGTTIIMPMLGRLKKCRDIINLETLGEVDLFNNTEYRDLQRYFSLEKTEDLE